MGVYYLSHPHHLKQTQLPPSAMALGFFDGMHLGHQKVIRTAKNIAEKKGLQAAVMTFDPHPAVVLGETKQAKYLTPLSKKEELIRLMGIDLLYVVHFDQQIFNVGPQQFVDEYIVGLGVQHVVAGFDYTYGKQAEGNMNMMPSYAEGRFQITVVDKLISADEKVSSTAIRQCVREGRMGDASALLGRYYETTGTVVTGEQRGRTIGFPTANIEEDASYLLPPTGVYAVRMNVDGSLHDGVASIGYKPTFHEEHAQDPDVEVHLLDFNGEIYGKSVAITWYKKLRDEVKFDSASSLIDQMTCDKQEASDYLARISACKG